MDDQDKWFKLMTTPEELHPDLAPYVFDMRIGRKGLNSPLVQDIPHRVGFGGIANAQYAAKKAAVEEFERQGNVAGFVFMHERPWRFEAMVEYFDRHPDIPGKVFWEEVGHVWTDSENIYENLYEWKEVWNDTKPGKRFAMRASERKKLAALPDTVTVYRGVSHEGDDDGISWTLSREKAEWFAKRWSDGNPRVFSGTARKEHIHAVFNGRREDEVVINRVLGITEL